MTEQTILGYLSEILDPEIPVLNIVEMGIVRSVFFENEKVVVTITPTYSGCPAMRMIEDNIVEKLKENGCGEVELKTVYTPTWTTDWLNEITKKKLQQYGISPPHTTSDNHFVEITLPKKISCPYCQSHQTSLKSDFSSTACKAMYYCNACLQPFEYFKEI
ncbi:MAG: phenylacetate-CoA oxygenase subunit PaaJ [Ignavibacteriales bacterium]|nr:phenylacetate-CoA oxygenase subunit PaaJ [Ignavibacteriales bacterium]